MLQFSLAELRYSEFLRSHYHQLTVIFYSTLLCCADGPRSRVTSTMASRLHLQRLSGRSLLRLSQTAPRSWQSCYQASRTVSTATLKAQMPRVAGCVVHLFLIRHRAGRTKTLTVGSLRSGQSTKIVSLNSFQIRHYGNSVFPVTDLATMLI